MIDILNFIFFKKMNSADHSNSISLLLKQGLDLHQQGNLKEASNIYHQLLLIQPAHFDALYLSGLIAANFKNLPVAVEFFLNAIEINPNNAKSYSNLGNALLELGRVEEALENYDKAITLNPDYPEAYINRGVALQDLNRLDDSLSNFDIAISKNPLFADAFLNRGNVLQELGRFEEALLSYESAIAIDANYFEAYSNRGLVLHKLHRFEKALKSYDKAIFIYPSYLQAYTNRGVLQIELKLFKEALVSFDSALSIDSSCADAYCNKGVALQELNLLEESLKNFDLAIANNPEYIDAYINRGIVLQELKRIEESLSSFDRAISFQPNNANAQWNKSLTALLSGDYKLGWALYEWRWKSESFTSLKREFSGPLWIGNTDICGKTLLLHFEQGLGDFIQFCRYVNLFKHSDIKVILETPYSLVGLLSGLEGADEIIEYGKPLPSYDYHCPLMSLPLAFKTNLNNIPSPHYYLKTTNQKIYKWSNLLGNKTKSRIGIVWSSNSFHKNNHKRNLSLEQFLPLVGDCHEFICLQKELREGDETTLKNNNIRYFCDLIEDFSDTAALCELMDLVISIDSSVAHLAGAIGKPTWILLPYAPDWRWLLDKDESPWYESVRLFRQDKNKTWSTVIHNISISMKLFNF